MKRSAARAAADKIFPQFPESPEGLLMFKIIEQAILDLSIKEYRETALRYLAGELRAAALAGVEAEWIRDVLARAGEVTFSVKAEKCKIDHGGMAERREADRRETVG